MAGEVDPIVAVFKADIEQFKAQMAALGIQLAAVEAKTDGATGATEKFETTTKKAHGSIQTLSKGLGGITGLLAITGRLFGVNTAELQELVFTSREFVKIGREIHHTQQLTNAATKIGTEATKELTIAQIAWNAAKSIGVAGLGLLVTGITLAVAVIYNYITANNEAKKANDDFIEGNKKLADSIKTVSAEQDFSVKLLEAQGRASRELEIANKKVLISKLENLAFQQEIESLLLKSTDEQRKAAKEALAKTQSDIIDENRAIAILEAQGRTEEKKQLTEFITDIATVNDEAHLKNTEKENKEAEKRKAAIIKNNEEVFQIALKQLQALNKLGQVVESPLEKINREHEERLKAAGLFGRDLLSLTEFEHSKLIAEENDYQAQIQQIVDESEKEQQRLRDAAFKLEEEADKSNQDAFLKNKTAAQKEILKLAKKGNKDALEILKVNDIDEYNRIQDGIRKDRIEKEQKFLDIIVKANEEAFQKKQDVRDTDIDRQKSAIDQQRDLASKGLANTLAFEERKLAEQQRANQKAQQNQKKVKLLESFLNTLAENSKAPYPENKKALQNALLQVALATAATAIFAEEGGIIGGSANQKSNLTRRHKGGGDVLLHAQVGEGIIPVDSMQVLGKRNFEIIRNLNRNKVDGNIGMLPRFSGANQNPQIASSEIINELKSLKQTIKDKKETNIHWDSHNKMITETIENGLKNIMIASQRKPRI